MQTGLSYYLKQTLGIESFVSISLEELNLSDEVEASASSPEQSTENLAASSVFPYYFLWQKEPATEEWTLFFNLRKAMKLTDKNAPHFVVSDFSAFIENLGPIPAEIICFSDEVLEPLFSKIQNKRILYIPSARMMLADAKLKKPVWEALQKIMN